MPVNPIILERIKQGNLVETAWKGLSIKLDIESLSVQYIEMRKAFFCGFYACFDVMGIISKGLEESVAMKALDTINKECQETISKVFK